jgi:hypothetical protein
MIRVSLVSLVFTLAAVPALHAQQAIDQLGWMAGCWEQKSATRSTVEMWMAPAGGLMLGASRTVAGGALRESEQLSLRQDGAAVVYHAAPSGQAPTSFRSTVVSDTLLVVENPTHDFPTKISYRRVTADSVVATVQGPGPNGMRGFALGYGRVKCER